jgi:hypothetical protein
LAVASIILIAVGIGAVVYKSPFREGGHSHRAVGHDQLLDGIARYVDTFERDPDSAQQILLANYEGRPTSFGEAAEVLGYQPLVAKGLPAGCALGKVYLLNMPCCTCAQALCRSKDGRSIAVFEHDIDQPAWFRDRPTIDCRCRDVPTNVVQLGDRLAATWKHGKRYITIIGARDLQEVVDFIEYFTDPYNKNARDSN